MLPTFPLEPIDILLIEADPADVGHTEQALKAAKIINHLHTAADVEQAVAFLHRRGRFAGESRPDLVLLDLDPMTDAEHELLREIDTDPTLQGIPVVVLTSRPVEEARGGSGPRAFGYLRKPLDVDRFVRVVGAVEGFGLSIMQVPPVSRS